MDYRELIGKVLDGANKIVASMSDITKETADKAGAKISLKKAEIERDRSLSALGRIYYQIEKGVLTRDDEIIAAAIKRIDEQEEEIEKLKNKQKEAAAEAEPEEKAEEAEDAETAPEILEALVTQLEEEENEVEI